MVLMIIVDAAGSIWIDKDVEGDKGNCGTTPPSPFSSPLLHSPYLIFPNNDIVIPFSSKKR